MAAGMLLPIHWKNTLQMVVSNRLNMKAIVARYTFILTVCAAATAYLWKIFLFSATGVDDANIFFVYAHNFAAGHGFVYNIGGERVEGFSSLLWTLLCALAFKLTSQPERVLLVVNVLLLSIACFAAWQYLEKQLLAGLAPRVRLFWQALYLLLLISTQAFLVWNTITLMENALWSTLLLLAGLCVLQEDLSARRVLSWLLPLSVLVLLTRPEAILWLVVFAGILFVRKFLQAGWRAALQLVAPFVLTAGVTYAALTAFRLSYFGYPLPNTYYAKVSPSQLYNLYRGWDYLYAYLHSDWLVWAGALAAVLLGLDSLLRLRRLEILQKGAVYLPVLGLVGLLEPLLTGGDHFGAFRVYQNIYPFLLLCLIYLLAVVLPAALPMALASSKVRWAERVFLASAVVLLLASFLHFKARAWQGYYLSSDLAKEFVLASEGRESGVLLGEMFQDADKLPSVGMVIAGGIKLTYAGEVVDLMGLNNTLMAHNGGDRKGMKNHAAFEKATFYQLLPDLVDLRLVNLHWSYSAGYVQQNVGFGALKEIYNDTDFQNLYVFVRIDPANSDKFLVGWMSKRLLAELPASDKYQIEVYPYP